jgi:hypothetical protein
VTGQGHQATAGPSAVLIGGQSPDEEISQYYGEHYKAVLGFLVYACRCPEPDAEDIVQDIILVIRDRHWRRSGPSRSPRPTGIRPLNAGAAGCLASGLSG